MSISTEEAIRILAVNGWGFTDGELKEATQMAITALKSKSEAEEYRTPKKPAPYQSFISIAYACPRCFNPVTDDDMDYCPICGQALDWSEVY